MHKWILAAALLVASAAHAAIPASQREALIAFYNATGGPNWKDNSGWLGVPGTECSWYQVGCDGEETKVLELSPADNNLQGTIPASIANLVDLKTLVLFDNGLTGEIQSAIGQLANLEILILDRNLLTGPIPPSIGNLRNLTLLNFDGNQLTGPLPTELGNLSNLEELDFSFNQINGAIPRSLGQLSNLKVLDMNINKLSGPIPRELGNLSKLERLGFVENDLSETIPTELGRLTELRSLRLSYNELTGGIPAELRQLRNLEELDLANNPLGGSIPIELAELTKLRNLFLFTSQLTGSIPPDLFRITTLEEVNIGDNRLTGSIPNEVGLLTNLRSFTVNANLLTGRIPAEIGSLTNLRTLELLNNELEGPIPPELGRLSNLQFFDIAGNNLTGTIPRELGALKNLLIFSVYENQLEGEIPPELGNLTELGILYLTTNRFTGAIPDSLRNLKKVEQFYLAGNRLTGPIPDWIGELTALRDLFIGSNELTGSIPTSVGQLTNLENFDAGQNRLTGSIPREFGRLQKMDFLTLEFNELSGSIPVELGDAKALAQIRLAFNELSGPLPSSLGGLSNLEVLVMPVNNVEGPIPPELGNLGNLMTLSLASNRFSGAIPADLGRLQKLQEIDLSYNALRGAIPDTLRNIPLRNQGSDFGFNALFTNDPATRAFINSKQHDQDFEASQTVPPTNVRVTSTTDRSAVVEWDLIRYIFDEGGYQVIATPTGGGAPVAIATTSEKTINSIIVRGLEASTTYSFTVSTVTHPFGFQENLIVSDLTAPVTATTTARVTAPPDVVVTDAATGLLQVDGVARNEDSFTLTNFGDVATTITFFREGEFFTLEPETFLLAGGASQIVRVRSVPQPVGTYYGYLQALGEGVGNDVFVYLSLLSVAQSTGTVIAEPVITRVEIAGAPGSDSVGQAQFRNRGTATLFGIVLSDQPWLVPGRDPIRIDPGTIGTVNFTIVRSRRPPEAEGALTANLALVYIDGSSFNALRNGAPASAGAFNVLRELNQTAPAGFSISLVTVVDIPRPTVGAGAIPAISGDVALFASGVASFTRLFGQFVSDISIQNAGSARAIGDVRLFFSAANTPTAIASLNAIAASQSVSLPNVVSTVYGSQSAVGSLQVRSGSAQNLTVSVKLVNLRSNGTFTGDVPLFRSDRSAGANEQLLLTGVRKSASTHTDLYLQETAGAPLTARVEFLDANGSAAAASQMVTVGMFGMAELLDVVPTSAATVVVTNIGGSGRLAGYARVTDEASGDTWSIVDWSRFNRFALTDAVRVPFVDGVGTSTPPPPPVAGPRRRAVAHGSSTTLPQVAPSQRSMTELILFNPAATEVRVRLELTESSGRTTEREVVVGPRRTIIVADAGSASQSPIASLVITPLRGGQVAVTARSSRTVSGTQGTSVPVVPAMAGLRVGQVQRFSSLDDSTALTVAAAKPGTFRTAFGLVETAGASVTVRARVLLDAGRTLTTQIIGRDFVLAPGQQLYADNMVRSIVGDTRETALGELHNLQLQFEIVSGQGAVVPFVIETDNGSGDQLLRLE